jgi:hypothetical protein
MNTNIHLWLHGLLAAVLSALGDSGTVALGAAVVAPGFLRDSRFWEALAGMLVFSALKTVFAYLRGANSYSPISVAASSVSNAVASGTSMNGSYTFQTTIIQKSTTPATYAIAVPSGCTTVSFDYFMSAARIG